ncbi:hypothetical protein ACIQVL_48860 [Streptomyces sp. NPDC090499]|uniref:hypothetical protein n=1 Tax=Streptomyces sp. NPDC090499 TaxID=3365965 RepID=UPI0037FA5DC2
MSEQDFGDEIVPEDWPTVFTQIPVWLLLSGSTAQAYRMYAFLAEHINSRRTGRDRIAFPSMKAIARALGLKDHRDVKRYREELEQLGAVRAELATYAGGLRRRYRYWVRFNPPPGYAGPTSLSEFYEINDDVRSTKSTAGQSQGGKKPTLQGGESPTTRKRENPTLKKRDQEQQDQDERDDAPAARSASDGRRPTTGSSGSRGGGSAASGKTKPPSLTQEQRQQVDAFVQALPKQLADLLPVRMPSNLSTAVLEALAAGQPHERTPQQLIEYRLVPKWDGHYASRDAAGPLERPVGVLIAMLRRDRECGDARCDERTNVDTGNPCVSCGQRRVDERADRASAAPPAASGPMAPSGVRRAPAGRPGGPVPPPREAPMTEVSDQQRQLARDLLRNRVRVPK